VSGYEKTGFGGLLVEFFDISVKSIVINKMNSFEKQFGPKKVFPNNPSCPTKTRNIAIVLVPVGEVLENASSCPRME